MQTSFAFRCSYKKKEKKKVRIVFKFLLLSDDIEMLDFVRGFSWTTIKNQSAEIIPFFVNQFFAISALVIYSICWKSTRLRGIFLLAYISRYRTKNSANSTSQQAFCILLLEIIHEKVSLKHFKRNWNFSRKYPA